MLQEAVVARITRDHKKFFKICAARSGEVVSMTNSCISERSLELLRDAIIPWVTPLMMARLVTDSSRLMVVHALVQRVPHPYFAEFIFDAVATNCLALAIHPHGVSLLQSCLEHVEWTEKDNILSRVSCCSTDLAQNRFGFVRVMFWLADRLQDLHLLLFASFGLYSPHRRPSSKKDINLFPSAPISLPRRTFTVTAEHIHRKQRIPGHTTSAQAGSTPAPSSFVAVVVLAWVSFVRAKHPAVISADHDVYVFFFIDCRGRRGIDPPVSENYFGTCITGCLAKATARDLLAVEGFAAATAAVQREVRRAAEDPLALWDWMDLLSWLPMDRMVNISGSPRYPAYEVADFGWGAPSMTELITMNNCGQVVLVAAKGGGGSVQASVCMHPDHMGAFKSHFLNSLSV